jgi:hypothetical protein
MASTSTYSPSIDTFLQESSPTTNYGTGVNLKMGEVGSGGNRRQGVIEFDLSSVTNTTDIVQADFNLVALSSGGSATHSMTIARLPQSFTEGGATWNTYDGSNSWPGGGGAGGDAATDEPTYSLSVGTTTSQSVDIRDLVIDAVTRRSGVLRLVIYMASTGTAGNTNFGSEDTSKPDERPTLDIITATRKLWISAATPGSTPDGDLDNLANWSPLGVPGTDDVVLFNTGTVIATTGSLDCRKIYVGRNYSGSIGRLRDEVSVKCEELRLGSPQADVHLNVNESGIGATWADLKVTNSASGAQSMTLLGRYHAIITRTRSVIELTTDTVTRIDCSNRSSFTASEDVSVVRLRGSVVTLNNGAGTLTATNGSTVTVERDDYDETTMTISDSRVRCKASTIDVATIYSGSITFRNNEGAPIVCDGLVVYPQGLANTQTDSATFTSTAALTMYGGRVKFDPSQDISVS